MKRNSRMLLPTSAGRLATRSLGMFISAVMAMLTTGAAAAEIYSIQSGSTVYIDGELQPGDASKFTNLINAVSKRFHDKWPGKDFVIIVRPTSPGGSVQEAMEIGHTIRSNSMWVATNGPGQKCASACVLILAAGVSKLPGPGTVGIHRPTYPSSLFAALTQEEAMSRYKALSDSVSSYLAEMGSPPSLFRDMMQVPSSNIRWLTWNELLDYGLAGEIPAYAEYRHAQDSELRKKLVLRFGEVMVAKHEKAHSSNLRFAIECADKRGMENAKECFAEAERRFPDPLKGQNLQ